MNSSSSVHPIFNGGNMFKPRKHLTIILILLFFIACAPAPQNIEGENWVAFSAEHASQAGLNEWLFPDGVTYWSPSAADILAVEEGAAAFLQENESAFFTDFPVWQRLNEYNRQYIGVVWDGRKILYGNFFCSDEPDWKENFVLVMDGGACYFQFKFDPNTGEFFQLQVNGEA